VTATAPTRQATPPLTIAIRTEPVSDATSPDSRPPAGSPVVELNRAVAVAMADGPAAGLALLQRLEAGGALAGYYLLPATRADFLRRPGRNEEAASAYEEAAAVTGTGPERRFLNARLAEVRSQPT
jgi:RNA polymerase sigma-70 factor (ECF subfamily)